MRRAAAEELAAELAPLLAVCRFTGPTNPALGVLQIFDADRARTLCDLPLVPSWDLQERGHRGVCYACLLKLQERRGR